LEQSEEKQYESATKDDLIDGQMVDDTDDDELPSPVDKFGTAMVTEW